jgi:hypothetical protein
MKEALPVGLAGNPPIKPSDFGFWIGGMGNWAWGIGHGELGMGIVSFEC